MESKEWLSNSSLIDRLNKEYYRFSFFKAVELLESLFCDDEKFEKIGEALTPETEAIHFSVKPGITFPISDIKSIKTFQSENKEDWPVEMEVLFMGLIGPSGILPSWYNKLALERIFHNDFTLTSFLDIFHHRLISLFYLAWKKHHITAQYEPGATDKISRGLLSFQGLGSDQLIHYVTTKLKLRPEFFIYYTGLLSRTVPTVFAVKEIIQRIIGSGIDVTINQFVDQLVPLSRQEQSQIGSINSELGESIVCGDAVWENQSKFVIQLGPMSYDNYVRFLPEDSEEFSNDIIKPIFAMVRYLVGIEYEFEIEIYLRYDEIPDLILSGPQNSSKPQLGWTTFCKSYENIESADSVFINYQEPEDWNLILNEVD